MDELPNCFVLAGTKEKIKILPNVTSISKWEYKLDRKKEGLICREVGMDIYKITINTTELKNGQPFGKYKLTLLTLSPNPKSSQGSSKKEYKKYLIEKIEKHKNDLSRFMGEKILVYIIVYLRKERYENNDVDNFIKTILDALKKFTGDDKDVVCIIAEKKCLGNYKESDMDFLEQVLLVVTVPEARVDLFK